MSEQELPPILTPPPQPSHPAETEPRNFVGWVLLAVILSLMCLTSLVGSLMSPKGQVEKTSPYETLLDQETSMRAMADKVGQISSSDQTKDLRAQSSDSLSEPISGLVDKSKTDAEASRWYAAMRTEQDKPVPIENIAVLRRSKEDRDRALFQVYSSTKLTKDEADGLVKRIGNKTFYDRLATTQALEKAGDKTIRARTFSWKLGVGRTLAVMIGLTIFAAGGVVWIAFFRGRATGGFRPLGPPMEGLTLAIADRLAQRAAEILIIFIALGVFCAFFVKGQVGMIVEAVGILAMLPILARNPIRGKLITLRGAGFTKENLGENIVWGIAGFLAEFPLSMMMAAIGLVVFSFLPTPTHPIDQDLMNAKSIWQIAPIILFGSVTAPIWEEFVFRGLIFPALARVTSKVPLAAIMTGFIFAMIHPQGIVLWMALATVGTMGCVLTFQRRSLIPTIIMHMLHNTTIFALAILYMGKF